MTLVNKENQYQVSVENPLVTTSIF